MIRTAATLLALGVLSAPSFASPAIWEVRDQDSSIWLFGSFHILPPGVEWRSPTFDTLLSRADKVVLETDMSPEKQAELGAQAFGRGIYVDGSLLTDVLDEKTEAELRSAAAVIGQPVGSLLAMRPWMAANAITVAAALLAGYSAEGVELQIQPEIEGSRLAFLETGLEQIDILAGAPEDEQIAMLEATLDQLDLIPKLLGKMTQSWIEGTPEDLTELFVMEMGGYETAFLDRLIYTRNRNWITPIAAMLRDNEEALVVVGTAHLVGSGSVLDLLERDGYQVQRIE